MSTLLNHIKQSRIFKIYDAIVHIGISPELDYLERFRVNLLNTAAFFFTAIITLNVLAAFIDQQAGGILYYHLIYLLFTLPVFYLNQAQLFFHARIYALTVIPVFVLMGLFLTGFWVHTTYMLVLFIVGVISLYDKLLLKVLNLSYLICLSGIGLYYQLYDTPTYADSLSFSRGLFTIVATMLGIIWCWNLFFKQIVLKHNELTNKNAALLSMNEELEISISQSNLKTKLLSIIAHDVRSSTSSFNNLTHKVSYLIDTNDLDRLLSLGKSIEIEGMSLFRNLDNLLNWVASIKGKIIPVHVEFNPNFIITTLLNTFSPIIARNNLQINNQISRSRRLNSDEHIFKIIYQNILHNAIKYSDKNSTIHMKSYDEGAFSVFEIKNSGIGIDLDIIEQIRTGKKTNRVKNTGYGLGLGICFSLIALLNGAIEFESAPEETTAIIKIPSNSLVN